MPSTHQALESLQKAQSLVFHHQELNPRWIFHTQERQGWHVAITLYTRSHRWVTVANTTYYLGGASYRISHCPASME